MGGKGKSGPVQTNSQLVQMQMQAAADAKQKDAERTARLNQGVSSIDQIFSAGGGTTANPLASLANQGDVAYDPFRLNGTIWDESSRTYKPDTERDLGNGFSWGKAPPDANGVSQYAIYDMAHGSNAVATAPTLAELSNMTVPGMAGSGPASARTSTGSGFDDNFYGKFRNSIIDYYMPQEAEQYSDARSKLAYTLARAGSLNSSIAGTDVAKLSEQDQLNQAQIGSQADTQTAGLRNQVAQAKQQALAQLYATEDPSVAANTATNLVANANLTTPLLNPAGALFAPITAGVGNAISGFTNPYAYINPSAGGSVASTPTTDKSTGISGVS